MPQGHSYAQRFFLFLFFASGAAFSIWLVSTPIGNRHHLRPVPTFLGTQQNPLKSVVAFYAQGIYNKPPVIAIQWLL